MKRTMLSLAVLATAAMLTAAAARVSRTALTAMEKSLDQKISSLWPDNQYLLIGNTRGVYLDGYGAVFTAEVNLVANPLSLMSTHLSPAEVARYRQTKIERAVALKKALREALASTAASLDTVPPEEKVVMVAFLDHFPFEDMNGVPTQITVEGQKKALLEAQRSGGKSLETAVKVTEN